MIRVGVIGCGYWGPNLVRNFAKVKDCRLAAIADDNPARMEPLKRTFPYIATFPSGPSLIASAEIDAVAIATPISPHFNLARQALLNGKHVLIEKPITATSREAETLIQLAEKNKRTLMVDHTFVYSGPVRKIREIMDANDLGDIHYYDSVRVNLGLFQRDSNVLWDLGPHDISLMTYLLKKKPKSISAIGSIPIHWKKWKPESVVYVTIQFTDNTLAHFHLNWLSPIKIRRVLIGGSKKMIVYDHLDPDNQVKIYDKSVEVQTHEERFQAMVQYRTGDMLVPKVDQTEALEIVCRHFVESIMNKTKPLTDGEEGLRVVRLVEAAQHSLVRGGKSVSLSS